MKRICNKYNIPTAKFFVCTNLSKLKKSIKNFKAPIVVKADGLAA